MTLATCNNPKSHGRVLFLTLNVLIALYNSDRGRIEGFETAKVVETSAASSQLSEIIILVTIIYRCGFRGMLNHYPGHHYLLMGV